MLNEDRAVKRSVVDREKAEKNALYDGYFALITSEMDYDRRKDTGSLPWVMADRNKALIYGQCRDLLILKL